MTFEELMSLKKGDRIVAKGKTWADTKAGDEGTVVALDGNLVVIEWDNNVNGWSEYYGIKDDRGEFIGGENCCMIELLKNSSNTHKLVITCEDGKHTNAKYYINNKLVSESNTLRNEKYDDFDFKTAVDNCVDRMDFTDKTVTKGSSLIGRTIKKGQRVRIINVEPHKKPWHYICLEEYIGKEGVFNSDCIFTNDGYRSSITFDKKYMNAIDEENGYLCWRWDEIELID